MVCTFINGESVALNVISGAPTPSGLRRGESAAPTSIEPLVTAASKYPLRYLYAVHRRSLDSQFKQNGPPDPPPPHA